MDRNAIILHCLEFVCLILSHYLGYKNCIFSFLKIFEKIVNVCLHSSSTVQISLQFDEFLRLKKNCQIWHLFTNTELKITWTQRVNLGQKCSNIERLSSCIFNYFFTNGKKNLNQIGKSNFFFKIYTEYKKKIPIQFDL